jgi:hypothetical protein
MEDEVKAVQRFMQTMVNLSVDTHNAREQFENLHLVLAGQILERPTGNANCLPDVPESLQGP